MNTIGTVLSCWGGRTRTLILFTALLLLVLPSYGWAGNAANEHMGESKNLKKYLKEKYPHVRNVKTTIKEGPKGKVIIIGSIVPRGWVSWDDKNERAQSVAKAFIVQEPTIFGVTSQQELQVSKAKKDPKGNSHIKLKRYVGELPLDGMDIAITLNDKDEIMYVAADVEPVPAEVYDMVNEPTIDRPVAMSAVMSDLEADGIDTSTIVILNLTKEASSESPYVIWKADVNMATGEPGRWLYVIDAFSGEIISKNFILQSTSGVQF